MEECPELFIKWDCSVDVDYVGVEEDLSPLLLDHPN